MKTKATPNECFKCLILGDIYFNSKKACSGKGIVKSCRVRFLGR